MYRVSIVLSGGSSKGAYQIGFFKALKKSGLPFTIDAISSTSIGALNAYSFICKKLEIAEQLWASIDVDGIWHFRKKNNEEHFISRLFSKLIDENGHIPCDFYITLSEMSTMTPEYFNLHGDMNPAKRKFLETSISIPLITSLPLHYNGKVYFDGGVTDNIPLTPIKERLQDIIFVVHFMPDYQIPVEYDTSVDVIDINMSNIDNFKKGNFNFKPEDIREMIDAGETYTTAIIHDYLTNQTSKRPRFITRDKGYYYFSGARFLSILNKTLKIGNKQRRSFIDIIRQIIYK